MGFSIGDISLFGASPTNILKTQLKENVPFFNSLDQAKDNLQAPKPAASAPAPSNQANNADGSVLGAETSVDLGSGATGSGSGSNSTGYTASDLAYLDSQEGLLRNLLSRSGVTLDQGLANLSDSFNSQTNDANKNRTRALQDYQLQDESDAKAKDAALGTVDQQARTLADSLRSRIGMASGSDSSAYQIAAPGAVARDASTKRNSVLNNFGENQQSVELQRNRSSEDFDKLLASLASQRKSKESDLRAGVLQNEQDIEKQIADIEAQKANGKGLSAAATAATLAPIASQITQKQNAIDALFDKFRTPTYNVTPVDTSPAQLKDYIVNSTNLSPDASTATQDPTLTAAYYLKKQQDQNALAA